MSSAAASARFASEGAVVQVQNHRGGTYLVRGNVSGGHCCLGSGTNVSTDESDDLRRGRLTQVTNTTIPSYRAALEDAHTSAN